MGAKERHSLLGKFKNAEHGVDGLREQLDEELGAKDDILRQYAKVTQEADLWRQKYESEGLAKAEELEMAKLKLQAEIDQMAAQADQAHILNSSMEKKAKQ